MTRSEAWEIFRADHLEETERIRKEFAEHLQNRIDKLTECIYKSFENIKKQADEQKKNDCVYFLYSLQRYDLTQGKAIVRLDVANPAWYLDEKPLEDSFDVTFLFQEYFDFQEKLLREIREYMGKINIYDIWNFIQGEIMICNKLAAHILRFVFRQLENQETFAQIGKMPFWVIRWGEYKDESEIVMQINREVREEKAWQEKLERYQENPNVLVAEHWYKGELNSGDCSNKNMYFMFFEECSLKNIDFHGANLTGSRFSKCKIKNCNFSGANLNQTYFSECVFYDNEFQNASFNQAIFLEEGFSPEMFSEKQLGELLVASNMENQGGGT